MWSHVKGELEGVVTCEEGIGSVVHGKEDLV